MCLSKSTDALKIAGLQRHTTWSDAYLFCIRVSCLSINSDSFESCTADQHTCCLVAIHAYLCIKEGFEIRSRAFSASVPSKGQVMHLLISISPFQILYVPLTYLLSRPGMIIPKVSVKAEESSEPYSHFAFLFADIRPNLITCASLDSLVLPADAHFPRSVGKIL